jgi:hypothetical protein
LHMERRHLEKARCWGHSQYSQRKKIIYDFIL